MSEVRVRFAPSPTGSPHIGNIRSAVFNWLYARHTGGKFILRIEDTDRARLVPGVVEELMYDLRWLGLDWDEGPDVGGPYGPYCQSERLELYTKHAEELVDKGLAYRCWCSPERLAELRGQQEARKESIGYDRRCRDITSQEAAAYAAESPTSVVRFKMPLIGTTSFNDIVRGEITFDNSLQDDFVILKSDGYPTYNFASVVDDHHMRISHVVRGEEFVSSAPKHIRLYEAFGWEPPLFAHAPLIVGPDRSKLSKRHGAAAFSAYIEQGYLPQALLNFLALLGWSAAEDRDLYSARELIDKFQLEGIISHPAVFDIAKLQWMNGQYIRACGLDRLATLTLPYLRQAGLASDSPNPDELVYIKRVIALVQERMPLLSESPELTGFFFVDQPEFDPKAVAKWLTRPRASDLLLNAAAQLDALGEWTIQRIEQAVRSAGSELGFQGGDVIHPIRVAVTGRTVGPGLFQTIEVLGKERTVARLQAAAAKPTGEAQQ